MQKFVVYGKNDDALTCCILPSQSNMSIKYFIKFVPSIMLSNPLAQNRIHIQNFKIGKFSFANFSMPMRPTRSYLLECVMGGKLLVWIQNECPYPRPQHVSFMEVSDMILPPSMDKKTKNVVKNITKI